MSLDIREKTVADKMVELMEAYQFSQTQLANASGVARITVSRLVNGVIKYPNRSTLQAILIAFYGTNFEKVTKELEEFDFLINRQKKNDEKFNNV